MYRLLGKLHPVSLIRACSHANLLQVVQGLIPTAIRAVVSTATTVIILCQYDVRLAMICVVAVPFEVLSSYAYSQYFQKYNEKVCCLCDSSTRATTGPLRLIVRAGMPALATPFLQDSAMRLRSFSRVVVNFLVNLGAVLHASPMYENSSGFLAKHVSACRVDAAAAECCDCELSEG